MTDMMKVDHMIQQHILEYESRLKHVDELLERAQQEMAKAGGDATELVEAKQARDQLSGHINAFKLRSPDQWTEDAFENTGPMVVWDTLAQKLEKLVERLER